MNSKALQELVGILIFSAGLGLVVSTFPEVLTSGQRLFFLIVLLVVFGTVYKTLRPSQQNADMSAVPMATLAHSNAKRPTQQQPLPHSQGAHEATMRRYFAWLEKKLSELVEREQLECGLAGIKRGPLVITLRLRLINPTQRDLQKLMRLGPALAQLLQVEAVRIADTAQGVMIEVPSPQPLTPNGALLARHTSGMRLAIGVDAFARPVFIDLEDHGAVFWVGPSRRGKTQSMKAALYAILQANGKRIRFAIIATPAKVEEDWGIFATVAGCLGIACTKEEIATATTWLVQIMNSGKAKAKGLHIIVIIDDLPKILKAVPTIQDDIADLAGLGAGLGIHLWVGTQGAGSKRTSGGTDVENNVTARILYRPATTRTGSQSAGTGGLNLDLLSSYKGDALVLIHGLATRIATAWIADQAIALLPEGKAQRPPWQREQTQPAQNQVNGDRTTLSTKEDQAEPPQNQREPGETKQNQPEPPAVWSSAALRNGHATTTTPTVAESVLEPGAKPGLAPSQPAANIEAHLRYLVTLTNEALRQENLGFDGARFPTSDQQRVIVVAFGISNSLNKTCLLCYGYKNPKVIGYIKAVIEGAVAEMSEAPEQTPQADFPDTIDLNTEAGRKLLRRLQEKGFIKWPDIDSLLEEGA